MIPPEKREQAKLKRQATIARKKELKKEKKLNNAIKRQASLLTSVNDETNKVAYTRILQVLYKYKNKKFFNTGAKYKKRDVVAINVKQRLHIDTILEKVNKISKILGEYGNGFIDLSVKGDKWYYHGQTEFGRQISYRDEYDGLNDDTFDEFTIYITKLPAASMGNSKNNDCVYNCLLSVLGSRLIKLFPEPIDLKKFLKIPYYQKVDIGHIELIEKKLNVSINVSGDYTYTSKLSNNKVINLKCINEHCELQNNKKDIFRLNKKMSYIERKPLIFDKVDDFTAYDGYKEFQLTKELRNSIYDWKTEYILINKFDTSKSIVDNYNDFIDMANNLKKQTNGRINLYKSGNFTNTALNLFNDMTKHISHPPDIDQVESEFINEASQGAIIFNTKGYNGIAYKADVKSMYPSILSSNMLFPIKEGELKYITEFKSEYFEYGIYRAIIKPTKTKLFRFNNSHYYTHVDLTRAKELNLDIQLIIDSKPNFLYYSRDKCLTGSEIFGEYVKYLFELKEKKVKGAKNILNCLWGSLCERNRAKVIHKTGDIIEIPDDVKPSFRPYNDDNTIIEYTKYDKQHLYGWARIKPFILSKGRSMISKIMEPYNDILIRCHTDGVLFSEEPIGIKYGCNIGDLVFEGKHNIEINKSGIIKLVF